MSAYTTHDIRNIALVGQSGAGKTTLAEALLYHAGVIQAQGSIERGDTVCDFEPLEKKYQHSLNSALATISKDGKHINLIDTPGLHDFFGLAFGVLQAVETAAVVINAESGIEPAVHTMMQHARDDERCRMIIINKIDSPQVKLEELVEEIRQQFGAECLPLNLPSASGDKVVDCFFTLEGDETLFSSVAEAHTNIIDQVVEMDEELMELYLEQGEDLNPDQLHDPFEKALREGHLAGAALDTFEYEPIRADNPLLPLARDPVMNVLLTPHTAAGSSADADSDRTRKGDYTNLVRVLRGEEPFHRVA